MTRNHLIFALAIVLLFGAVAAALSQAFEDHCAEVDDPELCGP